MFSWMTVLENRVIFNNHTIHLARVKRGQPALNQTLGNSNITRN